MKLTRTSRVLACRTTAPDHRGMVYMLSTRPQLSLGVYTLIPLHFSLSRGTDSQPSNPPHRLKTLLHQRRLLPTLSFPNNASTSSTSPEGLETGYRSSSTSRRISAAGRVYCELWQISCQRLMLRLGFDFLGGVSWCGRRWGFTLVVGCGFVGL